MKKAEELQVQLNAWYSIFGTTQLTHAESRFNGLRRTNERYREALLTISEPARLHPNPPIEIIESLLSATRNLAKAALEGKVSPM